ncbi:hypothetical protein GCM10010517_53360 [Streptosporangium fragile]|uniref:HTH tetR-type domain-containing protein n=1 Tax=Streptosporangium fragile TaxID=46186 RepID=A0ABP6IJT6_9ACTN
MSPTASPQSGEGEHTRRVIPSAAVSAPARDRAVTLADVAEAAGTGRGTPHRRHPGRGERAAAAGTGHRTRPVTMGPAPAAARAPRRG